jgi:hypothetical protein
MMSLDRWTKLLECDRNYILTEDIPVINAQLAARLANLANSRIEADKRNSIDVFSEKEFIGTRAVNMAIEALFGGGDKKKTGGAKNIRSN